MEVRDVCEVQEVVVSVSNQIPMWPHLRTLFDVPPDDDLCDDNDLDEGVSHRSLDVRQHAGAVCLRSGVL